MPVYDSTNYSPPAAVASVTLRNPDNSSTVSAVNLLMDTGSDVTLLPRKDIDRLGVFPDAGKSYEIMSFDGTIRSVPVVELDLVLLRKAFRGLYLVVDREIGILGRDVLNHISVLFDGPNRKWIEALADNK